MAYIVVTCIVMAHIVMAYRHDELWPMCQYSHAYIVMAYTHAHTRARARTVVVYIVVTYIVMACAVPAYIIMAALVGTDSPWFERRQA